MDPYQHPPYPAHPAQTYGPPQPVPTYAPPYPTYGPYAPPPAYDASPVHQPHHSYPTPPFVTATPIPPPPTAPALPAISEDGRDDDDDDDPLPDHSSRSSAYDFSERSEHKRLRPSARHVDAPRRPAARTRSRRRAEPQDLLRDTRTSSRGSISSRGRRDQEMVHATGQLRRPSRAWNTANLAGGAGSTLPRTRAHLLSGIESRKADSLIRRNKKPHPTRPHQPLPTPLRSTPAIDENVSYVPQGGIDRRQRALMLPEAQMKILYRFPAGPLPEIESSGWKVIQLWNTFRKKSINELASDAASKIWQNTLGRIFRRKLPDNEKIKELWKKGHEIFAKHIQRRAKIAGYDTEEDISFFHKALDLCRKVNSQGRIVAKYEFSIPIAFNAAQATLFRLQLPAELEKAFEPIHGLSMKDPDYQTLRIELTNVQQIIVHANTALEEMLDYLTSLHLTFLEEAQKLQSKYQDILKDIPGIGEIKKKLLELKEVQTNLFLADSIKKIPEEWQEPRELQKHLYELDGLVLQLVKNPLSVLESTAIVIAQKKAIQSLLKAIPALYKPHQQAHAYTSVAKLMDDVRALREHIKEEGGDVLAYAEEHQDALVNIADQIAIIANIRLDRGKLATLKRYVVLLRELFLMRSTAFEIGARIMRRGYENFLPEEEVQKQLSVFGFLPYKTSENCFLAAFKDCIFAGKFATVSRKNNMAKKDEVDVQETVKGILERDKEWYKRISWKKIRNYAFDWVTDKKERDFNAERRHIDKKDNVAREYEKMCDIAKDRIFNNLLDGDNINIKKRGVDFLSKYGKKDDPWIQNILGNWAYNAKIDPVKDKKHQDSFESPIEKYQCAKEHYKQALMLLLNQEQKEHKSVDEKLVDPYHKAKDVAIKEIRVNMRRAILMKKASKHVMKGMQIFHNKGIKANDKQGQARYKDLIKKGYEYIVKAELDEAIKAERQAVYAEYEVEKGYRKGQLKLKRLDIDKHTHDHDVQKARAMLKHIDKEGPQKPQARRNNLQDLYQFAGEVMIELGKAEEADEYYRLAQEAHTRYIPKGDYVQILKKPVQTT